MTRRAFVSCGRPTPRSPARAPGPQAPPEPSARDEAEEAATNEELLNSDDFRMVRRAAAAAAA